MTRGQIAIIYKGYGAKDVSLMTSIEFNGDMYMPDGDWAWAGHGQDVIDLLKGVKDVANYQYVVAKFNNEHHHYCDCERLTYRYKDEKAKSMLDFSKDYFDNWFSDYVYLKNITDEIVDIIVEKYDKELDKVLGSKTLHIKPNEIIVLNFGLLHLRVKAE